MHAAADQDVRIPGERIRCSLLGVCYVLLQSAIGFTCAPESMLFQQRVCLCAPPDETSFSLYPHVFLPRLFQECVYQEILFRAFMQEFGNAKLCRGQLKYRVDGDDLLKVISIEITRSLLIYTG